MEGLENYDLDYMDSLMDEALNYDQRDYSANNWSDESTTKHYLNTSNATEYEIGINEMYRESVPSAHNFIFLEFTKIIHSTEKALYLSRIDAVNGETTFWISKSVCTLSEEDNLISIPIWLLK